MGVLKNMLFRFKLNLSKKESYFSDVFVSSDVLAKKDDDIAEELITAELDDEKIAVFRKQNSQEISKLKRLLYQDNLKNNEEVLNKLDKDSKEYVDYLTRELKDIEKIIDLTSKLIENEHLSVVYDVRRPLDTFSHYRNELVKIFKKINLSAELKTSIVNILVDIGKQYELIIKQTMDLANTIQLTGLPNDSGGLVKAIHDRTVAKKRLSGKTTNIITQIKKLESYFVQFKKHQVISDEEANLILNNLKNFREVFSQLTTFCKNRIDASGIIIREAHLLQKNKLEELKLLHAEIKTLSGELKSGGTKKDKVLVDKIIKLLNAYDKEVIKLEKKDEQIMRREDVVDRLLVNRLNIDEKMFEREQEKAIKELNNSSSALDKFRRASLTWMAIGLMSFQAAAPGLSFIHQKINGDKNHITVVGTPNQIRESVIELGINADIVSDHVLLNKVVTRNVVEDSPSTFSYDFINFELLNNNKERKKIILEEVFYDIIIGESEKAVDMIKNEVYSALKNTNMSNEEKDSILSQAINEILYFEGSIHATACVLNSTLNPENNLKLAERRAAFALQSFIDAANSTGIKLSEGSFQNIKITSGEVRRHAQVKKAVDKLNAFMTGGKISSNQFDAFFKSNPHYAQYRSLLTSLIDYQKLADNDNEEYIRFNIVAQLLKYFYPAQYEEIQNILNETRKIQTRLSLKIQLVIYGESKEIVNPIPINPIANMHTNINHYSGNDNMRHIKVWKQGVVSKGYKNRYFIGIPRGESKLGSGPRHTNRSGR